MDQTNIAGYTVIRSLGSGGMGQVFLAQHPRLPRQDALKVLEPSLSRNDEFRRRFARESETLAPISHPNIVTLYDRGEADGRLWLAMEYVSGPDAGALIRQHGRIDAQSTCRIVAGAAQALDFMFHRHGVTHRDIKPSNILLTTRDGWIENVKVADFGIAKSAAEGSSVTSTGSTVGTLSYLAPEVINGAPSNDRADQYALAVTAFQLLTGTLPYTGETPAQTLSAHLTMDVPRISERPGGLPAAVDAVFARALSKNPAARYGSSSEFAQALAAAASGAPIAPPTIVGPAWSPHGAPLPYAAPGAPSASRAEGTRSRRYLVAGGVVAAVALLLAGALFAFWQRGTTPTGVASATGSSSAAPTTTVDPTARPRQIAEQYALGAAAMDYRDMAAWKKRVVWHTSPELTRTLEAAAADLDEVARGVDMVSTASEANSVMAPSTDPKVTIVKVFVNVTTKSSVRPEGFTSIASYKLTMDNTRDYLITDVTNASE